MRENRKDITGTSGGLEEGGGNRRGRGKQKKGCY